MSSKIWYVYKIVFEDGTFYIGYRSAKHPKSDFLVKYFSSSSKVKEKISNGIAFSGEIIKEFDNQKEALVFEQEEIFNSFSNTNILNRACRFGVDGFGLLTEDAKKKISESSYNRWQDTEYREKVISAQKSSWTEERKQKQSDRLTGVKRPEHSKTMKGRTLSSEHPWKTEKHKTEEHKQHISEALKGKPKSKEHIQNLINAKKNRTEESKAELRERRRSNSKPKFEIDGVSFKSLQEASEKLKITPHFVKKLITHVF